MACAAEELQARLEPESMAEAVGERTTLRVTNVGGRQCQLRGYGGLQFLDYYGKPVETKLNRLQANPPAIAWERGQSSGLDLIWDLYQGPCVESETLQFTPPGDDRSVPALWGLGAVCRGGLLDATAFRNVYGG